MALPKTLIVELKTTYDLSDFVESGTYRGDTAVWAAAHFSRVTTIEASRTLHEATAARHMALDNVHFVLGDTRDELKKIVPGLKRPGLFWLDGHWSGGETYGGEDECPVLDEIRTVVAADLPHFIFIDDARLFLSPPPRPHRIQQWPPVDAVVEALKSGKHVPYIVVIHDAIIAAPEYARTTVSRYCQEVNTLAWQAEAKSSTAPDSHRLRALLRRIRRRTEACE